MGELARTSDITVFAREYDEGCHLRLPFVSLRSWSRLPSWLRVLIFAYRVRRRTRHGFDIVHSHMNGWCGDIEVVHVTPVRYNWCVRSMPLLKRLVSRVSVRVQTYLCLEALRVAPRLAHRTVAVSGLIAEQLRQAYGAALITPIIPPGVSRPGVVSVERRKQTRDRLGWSDEDQVCLLVARNPLRKGLPTALAALGRLPGRYKLLVVGANAASREFIGKLNSAGITARVRMVEETADVDLYYAAADLYIHPTLNDSFGMAPLEAMSFGLPVVVSPSPWCGFAQYVVHEREAMVLSHPENAGQLAGFIERISLDASLRERLVEGGYGVVDRHSWNEVARRYQDLYREVLNERKMASAR